MRLIIAEAKGVHHHHYNLNSASSGHAGNGLQHQATVTIYYTGCSERSSHCPVWHWLSMH